jgi:hypothetical protein
MILREKKFRGIMVGFISGRVDWYGQYDIEINYADALDELKSTGSVVGG